MRFIYRLNRYHRIFETKSSVIMMFSSILLLPCFVNNITCNNDVTHCQGLALTLFIVPNIYHINTSFNLIAILYSSMI